MGGKSQEQSMDQFRELTRKVLFRIRERVSTLIAGNFRRIYWTLHGMQVGKDTVLPRLLVTWPHQVKIGERCVVEPDVYFKFDGICKPGPNIIIGDYTFIGRGCEFNVTRRVVVGKHCLIASGAKFVDHDHGTEYGSLMGPQPSTASAILLGDDVWVGSNAVILQGVQIGSGAIVAAGAVVRTNVDEYEVVGGVPARVLRNRRIESRKSDA